MSGEKSPVHIVKQKRDDALLRFAQASVEDQKKAELNYAEAEVKVAKVTLACATTENERRRGEVEVAKAEVKVAKVTLACATTENERRRGEVEVAKAEVEVAKAEVKVANVTSACATTENERRRGEVEVAKAEVAVCQKEMCVARLNENSAEIAFFESYLETLLKNVQAGMHMILFSCASYSSYL